MGEFWGEWRGWEKVACWSTKAAISLKRVKRGKVTMDHSLEAYRNSPTLFRMVGTIPDPVRHPIPQDWGFATQPAPT